MQRFFPAGAGLLLCALAGCQSYAPYGPGYMNGGYTYGPTYAAPTYGSAPVGGYPSGPVYGPNQGRIAPTPSAAPFNSRTAPPPGTLQPGYSPGVGGSSVAIPPGGAAPRTVPQPIEPGGGLEQPVPRGSALPGTSSGPSNLGADDGDGEFLTPQGARPKDNKTSSLPVDKGLVADSSNAVNKVGADDFEPPAVLPDKPGPKATGASFESSTSDPARLNPYGFDSKGYSWLRGKLDFDPIDKRWHITYSTLDTDPAAKDTYGGSLTLAQNKTFEDYGFLTSDIVFVFGSINAQSRDRHGKPIYDIKKIWRLQDPASSTAQPGEATEISSLP